MFVSYHPKPSQYIYTKLKKNQSVVRESKTLHNQDHIYVDYPY